MNRAEQPWYETAFAAHYPLLYAHRDMREAQDCVALLPRLAPLGPGPVLDLGCGAGRHLPYLAAAQVIAVGVDLSADLLAEAARQRRTDAADYGLVRGDMRYIPVRDGACSAVLSLFTAFGYFGELADNAQVVAEVTRILRPAGHWFLDLFNGQRVAEELGDGRCHERRRELGPLRVSERRWLVHDPDRVVKEVQLQPLADREAEAERWGISAAGLEYTEEVALFTLGGLDELAGRYGLRRVAAAGGYDGQRLDAAASPRWLLVYRVEGQLTTASER